MQLMPTLHDAFRAHKRIKSIIRRTPVIASSDLAASTGARSLHLKLECLQVTGSFKVRGAANKILSLTAEEREKGVITFSTGNHGKAVAYVAGRLGLKAVVCLSEHVSPNRAEMIRALGAEISIKGRSQDEAERNYRELISARDLVPVVPFDDAAIIAGQGTIALEILTDLADADVLMVPLSGGGLLAGMALVAKAINPEMRVVGISIERSPAMLESLKAGAPVQVEERDTIAESLLGGIGLENRFTLPLVARFVDEHVIVSEEQIKDGMYFVFDQHRLIVEGAAAVGIGALLHRKVDVSGKKVAVLLSGSSIDSQSYVRVIDGRLAGGLKR
ncbi:MAG: pyridoxal-phosphate dependent enzyme [Desulfobacterales bacterium]